MCGYIWKAPEKGYSKHPGLDAVLTIRLSFTSGLDGACVACCLFLSTGSYHVCIQIHAPDAPQKPCVERHRPEAISCEVHISLLSQPDLAPCNGLTVPCCKLAVWGFFAGLPATSRLTCTRLTCTHCAPQSGLFCAPKVPVKERRLSDWEKLKKYLQARFCACPLGTTTR